MKRVTSLTLGLVASLLFGFAAVLSAKDAVPEVAAPIPPSDEAAPSDAAAAAGDALFPPDQVEQLVAPIALYPDAVLAQILMASTYPLDIVQADRWLRDKKDLEGEALDKAVQTEPWDPSVQALVFFPSVLSKMSENLDWTQDLGDAFLGQQNDVMAAVQKLRGEAKEAGNLETNEQQRVESDGDTIIVQPADPEVVYVPTYNPSMVYNQPAPETVYYPTTYTVPPTTTTYVTDPNASSSSSSWVDFGVGALVGGLFTAAIMWNRNDYNVYYGGRGSYGRPGYWGGSNYWNNNNWRRPNDINVNRNISRGDINIDNSRNINTNYKKWEHNPERRGNVRYRGETTNAKFDSRRNQVNMDRGRDRRGGRDGDRNLGGAALAGGAAAAGGAALAGRAGDRRGDGKLGDRAGDRRGDGKLGDRKGGGKAADRAKEHKKPAKAKQPAAKKPATKKANNPVRHAKSSTPKKKPTSKPKRQVKKSSPGKKSGAFQSHGGARSDRAASNRGHKSRGHQGSRSRGGGGGGRRGGGGRHR